MGLFQMETKLSQKLSSDQTCRFLHCELLLKVAERLADLIHCWVYGHTLSEQYAVNTEGMLCGI